MKKTILVFLALILSGQLALAQDYQPGIGVRGGVFSGVSFKHFISPNDAVEAVAAFHFGGLFMAGMYQRHVMAFDVPGLNWYYGAGAHLGFYEGRDRPRWFDERDRNYVVFGVNGVVGIEYKIEEIPISIGLDVTPALNIVDRFRLWTGAGLTLRYVF